MRRWDREMNYGCVWSCVERLEVNITVSEATLWWVLAAVARWELGQHRHQPSQLTSAKQHKKILFKRKKKINQGQNLFLSGECQTLKMSKTKVKCKHQALENRPRRLICETMEIITVKRNTLEVWGNEYNVSNIMLRSLLASDRNPCRVGLSFLKNEVRRERRSVLWSEESRFRHVY